MPEQVTAWWAAYGQSLVTIVIYVCIAGLVAGTSPVKAVASKAWGAVKGLAKPDEATTPLLKVIEQLELRRELLVKTVNEAELELAQIDKMLGVKT